MNSDQQTHRRGFFGLLGAAAAAVGFSGFAPKPAGRGVLAWNTLPELSLRSLPADDLEAFRKRYWANLPPRLVSFFEGEDDYVESGIEKFDAENLKACRDYFDQYSDRFHSWGIVGRTGGHGVVRYFEKRTEA